METSTKNKQTEADKAKPNQKRSFNRGLNSKNQKQNGN